jgi:aryl-alcohol dehydrogenase-like predicted oxidoreductase
LAVLGRRHRPEPIERVNQLADELFGKRVIHLAVRFVLDKGITTALWGARHPGQLEAVDGVTGWSLDAATMAEIDCILRECITDPVGPEFMAPPEANRTSHSEGTSRVP